MTVDIRLRGPDEQIEEIKGQLTETIDDERYDVSFNKRKYVDDEDSVRIYGEIAVDDKETGTTVISNESDAEQSYRDVILGKDHQNKIEQYVEWSLGGIEENDGLRFARKGIHFDEEEAEDTVEQIIERLNSISSNYEFRPSDKWDEEHTTVGSEDYEQEGFYKILYCKIDTKE